MNKLLVLLLLVLFGAGCATAVTPEPLPPAVTNEPTAANTPTPIPTATMESATAVVVEPTPVTLVEPKALPTTEPTPDFQLTRAARMPVSIPQDTVTFSSNAFAEDTGVLITFQHPRAWQTSYFSDSGASGLLVSNFDPNEAFWQALRIGDESILLIMPVSDIADLSDFPTEPAPIIVESNGKTAQFVIADGEIAGSIIQDEMAFVIFGQYPPGGEEELQKVAEIILSTLSWKDLANTDLSDVWLLGTRSEGAIEIGETVDGYVPLASISEWLFTAAEGQEFNLAIDTYDQDVMLVLDILNEDGLSLLTSGPEVFTGSIKMNMLKIPSDGVYRIQVTALTGFGNFGPWDPPAETKIYGWYKMVLEMTSRPT